MTLDRVIAVRNTKTVYRDGDRCIKVFNKSHPKSDILNEALNNARIEETGINIPKLLEVTSFDGKWALVYEFVNGKTMAQTMEESPEKKDELLERFVDIQLSVQTHTCPMLTQIKDKMQRKLSQTTLDAVTLYELHTRLAGMPAHNHVCHGDFNPSNVIIPDSGEPYIIDWSHVTQGNASADAACTYLLFWLSGDIGGAKNYLDTFCKKSDTPKQYVQKWLPIVAASQYVKGNEKEREFLLKCANAMD